MDRVTAAGGERQQGQANHCAGPDRRVGVAPALNASWQSRPAAPVRAAHHDMALTPATPGQWASQRPTLTMAGSDQPLWIPVRAPDWGTASPRSKLASSAAITRTAVAIKQSKHGMRSVGR